MAHLGLKDYHQVVKTYGWSKGVQSHLAICRWDYDHQVANQISWLIFHVPSGKHTKSYGKSQFWMEQLTIEMFNSYVTNYQKIYPIWSDFTVHSKYKDVQTYQG